MPAACSARTWRVACRTRGGQHKRQWSCRSLHLSSMIFWKLYPPAAGAAAMSFWAEILERSCNRGLTNGHEVNGRFTWRVGVRPRGSAWDWGWGEECRIQRFFLGGGVRVFFCIRLWQCSGYPPEADWEMCPYAKLALIPLFVCWFVCMFAYLLPMILM